jgi:hypothetical protein
VQKQRRRAVGYPFGVHALEETQVVDARGDVREQLGDPAAALAVLREAPRRSHDAVLDNRLRSCQGTGVGEVAHLAVAALQEWFVIEGIDLTGSPLHEQEDHPFGAGGMMAGTRGQGVAGRVGQVGQGEVAETAGDGFKGLAAIEEGVHG